MANYSGFAGTFSISDGVSSAYVVIVQPLDVQLPAVAMQLIKTTALSDTIEKYIATILDGGKFSYEQNYSTVEYARMLADRGIQYNFKITFPDSHTAVFAGIIEKAEVKMDANVIKIKTSGQVVSDVTYT